MKISDFMPKNIGQVFIAIKLVEALREYQEDGSIEELVDLKEIIYALAKAKGVSWEYFEEGRLKKLGEGGGFSKRLLLKEVVG